MGIANIINLCVLLLFSLTGLIMGLVKGFKRVKSWGSDYFLSSLATIGTGAILIKCNVNAKVGGIVIIACAIAYMFLFMGISKLVRSLLERAFERREDDMRKLGGVGVVNRLFGGYALAVKGFVIAAIILVLFYTVADLSGVASLKDAFAGVYSGGVWKVLKPYIFDFIILGVINLSVRHGYSNGLSSALWGLAVLGLVVGSGFVAYNLVFKTTLFGGAAQSFSLKLANVVKNADIALTAAKWILTAIMFIVLAIVVFVASFFVSRVITFARADSAYYLVDGILGATVLTLIFIAAMLFVGSIFAPVSDLGFMAPFTGYCSGGSVCRYFYTENLLTQFGMPAFLPLRSWFAATA